MLNLDDIKPGPLGKYSPLLYLWLTRKSRRPRDYRNVALVNGLDGKPLTSWRPKHIIIGHIERDAGGVISGAGGHRLSSIICGERGAMTGSGIWFRSALGVTDITEEFWAAYVRDGRCAWDRSHGMHMVGDEDRWEMFGDHRRVCRWCGHQQAGTVERSVEVVESCRTVWAPRQLSVPAAVTWPRGSMGEEVSA